MEVTWYNATNYSLAVIYMNVLKYISTTLLGIFFIFSAVTTPHTVDAQSAQNDCALPEFNITSSSDIYAIAGESFSYFVVTDTSVSYDLDSGLPSGLSFSNGQITGTPAASTAGDHQVVFSASNDCGSTTETINLTVLEGEGGAVATTSGGDDTSDQAAAGSVALNDIPETGLVADTALTVMFYLLALLLIAGWFSRRVQYAFAGNTSVDDLGDLSVIPSLEKRYTNMISSTQRKQRDHRRRFGDGMKR